MGALKGTASFSQVKLSLIVVNPVYAAKVGDVDFPFMDSDVI